MRRVDTKLSQIKKCKANRLQLLLKLSKFSKIERKKIGSFCLNNCNDLFVYEFIHILFIFRVQFHFNKRE